MIIVISMDLIFQLLDIGLGKVPDLQVIIIYPGKGHSLFNGSGKQSQHPKNDFTDFSQCIVPSGIARNVIA